MIILRAENEDDLAFVNPTQSKSFAWKPINISPAVSQRMITLHAENEDNLALVNPTHSKSIAWKPINISPAVSQRMITLHAENEDNLALVNPTHSKSIAWKPINISRLGNNPNSIVPLGLIIPCLWSKSTSPPPVPVRNSGRWRRALNPGYTAVKSWSNTVKRSKNTALTRKLTAMWESNPNSVHPMNPVHPIEFKNLPL